MNENLLHFAWKFRLFNNTNLTTTNGEVVEVLNPGMHNTDSGADFAHAKIRIGNVVWAGNVEIHINSSDWNKHKHQKDAAYNNVILHVVYNNDAAINTQQGKTIPTLQLSDRLNPTTISRYNELAKQKAGIPCSKHFTDVDEFTVLNYMDRLLVERLESKVEYIQQLLLENGNDWENLMYAMIARYLGASVNKEPFYMLAKSLPVKVWAKHADDPMQIAALVFGQAGLLDTKYDDEYPNQLRKEYLYLKRLHNLQPMPHEIWKFLRLRPANFPTIRLAQLAAFMYLDTKMFSKILEAEDVKAIHRYLDVDTDPYWQTHYHFDKPSKNVKSHIGSAAKNILLINAIAPVLFAYGKYKGNDSYCNRAMQLLEDCAPESNAIITMWKGLKLKPANAYQTQALIQLKNVYCNNFNCLNCAIGHKVLA